MSGFDFDALRDPDAPLPGGRERAGVDARARQLRARARRNRLIVSATAIAATTAIVLGVVAATRSSGPSISVENPSSTTASNPTPTSPPTVADRFIPPTTVENGRVVLPVTQPDGKTFTLRYPPRMRIAQLGFTGGIDINSSAGNGVRCCSAAISYTTIARVYGDTPPIATYRGAHGESVPLYAHRPYKGQIGPSIEPPRELAFQFGPWLVEVYLLADQSQNQAPMTAQQIATLARSITASVDPHGYLLLHTSAPFSLGEQFAGGFGSETADVNYSASNNVAFDSHIVCGHPPSAVSMDPIATPFLTGTLTNGNVQWCVEKVLHVQATGSAEFLTVALHDLDVTPLRSAAVTPSTTTTTISAAPAANSVGAVSASWVSPQHGWVLERNGRIDTTTDSGLTWHQIGSLGVAIDAIGMKIRFADSSRGFAFDGTRFLASDDGGVAWNHIATPFSSVFDLAISRGVVYAAGIAPKANNFRIWSAPADTLAWREDPLVIPTGAGPIPTTQLVFSGVNGWVVEVDRTVVAGARMATPGAWSAWTPPCRTLNGPAYLAASTSTELVAVCSEHDYGGGPVTKGVYFSHDGGTTFRRHDAPAFGPIASPSPDIAVVGGPGGGLQRTIDGGATWHLVLPADTSQGFADYGFTTSTQGFFIFGGSGEMVMTYDAGATWQKVMGP